VSGFLIVTSNLPLRALLLFTSLYPSRATKSKAVKEFANEIGKNIGDKEKFPVWNPDWEKEEWLDKHPIDDFFKKEENIINECPQICG
jgi:hypothetical protein